MKKTTNLLFIICLFTLSFFKTQATTVEWNLQSLYGINQAGFASVIADARAHFLIAPNDVIIIKVDAGTYVIGGNGSYGIDLTGGLAPGPNGRLIIEGAGMNLTTLVFSDITQDMIKGRKVSRFEIRDLHMTRDRYTVTQGTVVSVGKGEIILDLQPGFPTPLELWQDWENGRYLRRYTTSTTDPQVIQTDNTQVAYGRRSNTTYMKPELVSGNQWKFYLNSPNLILKNYAVGELVGIKSKFEGNTYWFTEGEDFVARNIKWTHSTRGLVRGGFSHVKIIGCRVERAAPINGQTPCMASPSGGPQMNQYAPTDPTSTDMMVDNYFCDSPGDDCVAFFNVDGGKVLNSTLKNSFARGIMVTSQAKDICVTNTTIPNSPIELELTNVSYWTIQEAITAGILKDCSVLNTESPIASKKVNFNYSIRNAVLSLASENTIQEIKIYSATGQLVKVKKGAAKSLAVDIQSLSSGIYILQVMSDKGLQAVKISF